MTHLVARQTLALSAPTEADARAATAALQDAADRITAAIAAALDGAVRGDARRIIDRLEIDLGRLPAGRLADALIEALTPRLAAALAAPDPQPPPPDDVPSPLLALATFCRFGRLPWWTRAGETPAMLVTALAAKRPPAAEIRRLLSMPGAHERLVRQLDDRSLARLARLAEGADPGPTEPAMDAPAAGPARLAFWSAQLRRWQPAGDAAAAPPPAAGQRRAAAPPLPSTALPAAGTAGPVAPPAAGAAPADQRAGRSALPPAADASRPAPPAAAGRPPRATGATNEPGIAALSALPPAVAARIQAALADLTPPQTSSLSGPEDLGSLADALIAAGRIEAADAALLRAAATPAARRPPDPPLPEAGLDSLPTTIAGLPLIWPFLPAFCEARGLLADGAWRTPTAPHRATSLFYHLATGAEALGAEEQLPLAKLLAGLPIDTLHDPGDPLSAAECAAADALLAAIIEAAPGLGRLSPDGFRRAFLARPGSLATAQGHWLLRIERRTHDILLDRLPWPRGWVKLPWMPLPLAVEW